MRIRKANKADIPAISYIHAESWRNAYSNIFPQNALVNQIIPSLIRHWENIEVQEEDLILLAEEAEIVGFIAIWCRPIPFIDNLHIMPSHRSKRIGSILMENATVELLENGMTSAYLWVFNENVKAINFYEKLGGLKQESAEKDIFGYKVLSTKIEWNNLKDILKE